MLSLIDAVFSLAAGKASRQHENPRSPKRLRWGKVWKGVVPTAGPGKWAEYHYGSTARFHWAEVSQ